MLHFFECSQVAHLSESERNCWRLHVDSFLQWKSHIIFTFGYMYFTLSNVKRQERWGHWMARSMTKRCLQCFGKFHLPKLGRAVEFEPVLHWPLPSAFAAPAR